jgi:hypothetical protein
MSKNKPSTDEQAKTSKSKQQVDPKGLQRQPTVESSRQGRTPSPLSPGGGSSEVLSRQPSSLLSRQPSTILQRQAGDGTESEGKTTEELPQLQMKGRNFAQFVGQTGSPPPIQPKLQLGPAGDRYEQEADRVARQVVRGLAAPGAQRSEARRPSHAFSIPPVQRQDLDEDDLQAKVNHGMEGGDVDTDVARSIQNAKGGGAPLHDGVRSSMEQGFGADFSGVRVHTGGQADALNRSLNARAFTTGNDIFFGKGEYNPGSSGGQELLAHELTHTVQQGAAPLQRQADTSGAGNTTPTLRRPRQVRLANRSAVIQRIGAATQLRGLDAHYANEKTVQRPDLRGVVESYGRIVKKLYDIIEEIKPLDALDTAGLLTAKNKLKGEPGPNPNVLYDMVDPKDKTETLSILTRIHSTQLEKAQLQDIAIDEKGNLDMMAVAARLVSYDETPEAQGKTLVNIAGTKLKRSGTHATPGADVDTAGSVTQHSGKGWEIFVVGAAGDIHMASHKIGAYHHSSLLGGAPVSMAGEMKVTGGKIITMSNKSGHYSPGPEHFQHFLRTIENAGIPLDFTVMGWGVATGRADNWMNSLTPDQAPELKDTKAVWEYWSTAGRDPLGYLIGAPPVGLGWRVNTAYASHIEQPDGGGWKEATHDEVRNALETKFGPAPKKVVSKGNWGDTISWL